MIAVGGYVPEHKYKLMPQDSFDQGLGVFNFTEMRWGSLYDADAATYETPRIVKDGIARNGFYPETWDDLMVAEWLIGSKCGFHSL